MNIETLKSLIGWKRPTVNPTPTDLEIALARIHSDHTTAMVAIKLLTESVQSTAAANLNMTVVHEERHKDVLRNMKELKKEMMHSDNRHLAAFELALRPLLRAIEEIDKRLTNKLNGIEADLYAMRVDRNYELDAHTSVLNTKLNAVAERIDALTKLLAKDLIKHPEGVTVAPPKEETRGGQRRGAGRKPGAKPRPLDVQYADLSNKLQRCRAPKSRTKFMARLVALRAKMGMAPMSDRALGNIHARTAT